MNNEEMILQILTQMQSDIAGLKDGQAHLQSDIADLKREQSKINVIIETEIRRSINLLVDGHKSLNEKLDKLTDVKEEVDDYKVETMLHRAAIKDIYRKIG